MIDERHVDPGQTFDDTSDIDRVMHPDRRARILTGPVTIEPHVPHTERARRCDVVIPAVGHVHPVRPDDTRQHLEPPEVPTLRLVSPHTLSGEHQIERHTKAAVFSLRAADNWSAKEVRAAAATNAEELNRLLHHLTAQSHSEGRAKLAAGIGLIYWSWQRGR